MFFVALCEILVFFGVGEWGFEQQKSFLGVPSEFFVFLCVLCGNIRIWDLGIGI